MDRTEILTLRYDRQPPFPLALSLAENTPAPIPVYTTSDTLPLVLIFAQPTSADPDILEAVTLEEGDTIVLVAKTAATATANLFSLLTWTTTTYDGSPAYTGTLDLTTVPSTLWQGRPSVTVSAIVQVRATDNSLRATIPFTLILNRALYGGTEPTADPASPYLDQVTGDARYLSFTQDQTLDDTQKDSAATNAGLLRAASQTLTPEEQTAVRTNLRAGQATITGNTTAPYLTQTVAASVPIAQGSTVSSAFAATGLIPGMVVTSDVFAEGTTITSISGTPGSYYVSFSNPASASGTAEITATCTLNITPFSPASPGAIGGTTPAAGTFTTLTANTTLYVGTGTAKWTHTATTLTQSNSSGAQVFRVTSTGLCYSQGGFRAENNTTTQAVISGYTGLFGYDESNNPTFGLYSATGAATLTGDLWLGPWSGTGLGTLAGDTGLYGYNSSSVNTWWADNATGAAMFSALTLGGYTLNLGGNIAFASFGRTLAATATAKAAVTALTGDPVNNANTSITLADTDSGTILRCTASTAVTITVPSTLSSSFNCLIIQAGAGQITFSAGSGATINSYASLVKTAGQHAAASLLRVASATYNLSGNLA